MSAEPHAYFAEIADERLGEDVGGSYSPPDNPDGTGDLELSSDIAGMAIGGESVHELFHAVQQTYHALGPLYSSSLSSGLPYPPEYSDSPLMPDHRWITEGTADAIRIAFGQHAGLAYTGRPNRDYDYSLHYPCGDCAPREQRLQTYDTANFWLGLGEMLGSRDRVAYLERVWSHIGANPDLAHQGIGPVDSALRSLSGDGLATHFPAFIARYANAPDYFSRAPIIELRGATGTESRIGEAEPLAADAYRVRMIVPEGTTTEMEIDIVEDYRDLHLVVDGQLYNEATPDRKRNMFRRDLEGREEPYDFFVRVANVAENAAASRELGYTLRVALPSDPLAGNMTANFDGAFQGPPDEIPFAEKATMQWQAVLDIQTGPPETETDRLTGEERVIYPNDGSEMTLSGGYLHERCAPGHPDICNYWTQETFESSGPIAEDGGDLRIVSHGDAVSLEAELPVTVTTTVEGPFPGENTEPRTHFWSLACQSSGRWWGSPPDMTHIGPPNEPLSGSWASDDREVVEFECHENWQPSVYGPGSGESGTTSLSVQSRVEVQPRRR
ncbi:hypothetical protein [Fodinicurvata sp. EGI_FJ10296]|uniref:hypothetical protein n=1 Tax=Fodinicurvata sp. EGI_FJ10296 TaxID=3231908 RepID=UPI003453A13C